MKLLAFCLLLGMSAQAQITTGTVKLAQLACNRNVETGEITPKECTQAAQRAADETDGKAQHDITFTKNEWCKPNESAEKCMERINPPPPVDVPAVQETRKKWIANCWSSTSTEGCTWLEVVDTCADKSRVLLTSEDGKKHCIKFPIEKSGKE